MTKAVNGNARIARHKRIRNTVTGNSSRPRLCVFRSLKHIYAQLVDDEKGHTVVATSTLDSQVKSDLSGKKKTAQAEVVGTIIAQRAKEKGIKQVVFDRGGYKYHGRVKALAEAARKVGIEF